MVLCCLRSWLFPKPDSKRMAKPYLDIGPYLTFWRFANLLMATFFALAAAVQLNDPDWWLWMPFYVVPCVLSASILMNPDSVNHELWRLFSACTIVFGLLHLLYTFWIVRDITSYGYVKNPFEMEEGRECAGLAIVVIWTVICRMTAANTVGYLLKFRIFIFGAIIISCLPLLAWSMCFFQTGHTLMPYCRSMFVTGDQDL